jgi:hypothetical protein
LGPTFSTKPLLWLIAKAIRRKAQSVAIVMHAFRGPVRQEIRKQRRA